MKGFCILLNIISIIILILITNDSNANTLPDTGSALFSSIPAEDDAEAGKHPPGNNKRAISKQGHASFNMQDSDMLDRINRRNNNNNNRRNNNDNDNDDSGSRENNNRRNNSNTNRRND